jgi:Fic family protein
LLAGVAVQTILRRITRKKSKLDSLLPLPPALEKNLWEWFRVAYTYSSNAIAGNTLTHAETAQVIEKELTIGGKTIDEHIEAINHVEAVNFIDAIAFIKERHQLDLNNILEIHRLILQKINPDNAGRFREYAESSKDAVIQWPKRVEIPALMDNLVADITTSRGHLATIAARAHLQLVYIHPFVDGNGRTARLVMNLLLLQEEYPLVMIDVKDRSRYINAIQKAIQGDTDEYYLFIYENIERSLDEYIKAAEESE